MRLGPLLLLVSFALAACTTSSMDPPDSPPGSGPGRFCTSTQECPMGQRCIDSHCGDSCGEPETLCESYETTECCDADSLCCFDGFEHQGCYPAAQGCPIWCPNSHEHYCPNGQLCSYVPAFGTTQLDTCSPEATELECVGSCPAERQCGSPAICCGDGTACVDGCCVVPAPLVDAGVPDAS